MSPYQLGFSSTSDQNGVIFLILQETCSFRGPRFIQSSGSSMIPLVFPLQFLSRNRLHTSPYISLVKAET